MGEHMEPEPPMSEDNPGACFSHKRVKRKFEQMRRRVCSKQQSHRRLVFVIDRRNPESFKDGGVMHVKHGSDKKWKDRMYCIAPKEHHTLPGPCEVLPEALFCLTQQLLLPANPKLKGQGGGQPIGIRESLNGYMFALSFHVFSASAMRAYFSYNGQVQRFYMRDVMDLWPVLFAKKGDAPQSAGDHFRRAVENPELGAKLEFLDRDFDGFLSIFEDYDNDKQNNQNSKPGK